MKMGYQSKKSSPGYYPDHGAKIATYKILPLLLTANRPWDLLTKNTKVFTCGSGKFRQKRN